MISFFSHELRPSVPAVYRQVGSALTPLCGGGLDDAKFRICSMAPPMNKSSHCNLQKRPRNILNILTEEYHRKNTGQQESFIYFLNLIGYSAPSNFSCMTSQKIQESVDSELSPYSVRKLQSNGHHNF